MWTAILKAVMAGVIDNIKPIAIAALAGALYFGGYHVGAHSVKMQWDAADNKKIIATQRNLLFNATENLKITNEVSNDYQAKTAALDLAYNAAFDSLRDGLPDTIPGISNGGPGHNAAACPNGFSRRNKEAFIALSKQADFQTQRLIACQAWITKHSKKAAP